MPRESGSVTGDDLLGGLLDEEQWGQVLRAGGRAPSKHNTQPWRFRLSAGAVEIRADRAWRLPASDPDDRALDDARA